MLVWNRGEVFRSRSAGISEGDLCMLCKVCGGSVEFCEDIHRKEGLVTHPYLCCTKCGSKAAIQFSRVGVGEVPPVDADTPT